MNKTLLYVLLGLVLIGLIGGGVYLYTSNLKTDGVATVPNDQKTPLSSPVATATTKTTTSSNAWEEVGPAFAGTYADASVVTLSDGSYRMYAATQPEVKGHNFEVYSAKSTDGVTWTKESGTRKTMATFPQVIKLSDGTFRMYFQGSGVIKSAKSTDSLTFTDEAGTRIDRTNDQSLTFDNVAAPAVLQLADKSYVMVYRGSLKEAYTAEKVPNQTMNLFMWATSTDGLNWTKKGIAVDSRTNTDLKGQADGPELVDFDGEIRLYFTTYLGVYQSVFSNNSFSTPKFSWTLENKNAQPAGTSSAMASVPPGDPTLLKVGSTWYMYYGRHPEGIYYAKQTK